MLLARMKAIQLFSPAKVNLYLKIFGRREDGFHDLLSLVCPLGFGDLLKLEIREGEGLDRLICNCPELPLDSSNLIHRAIDLFRSQNPFPGHVVVNLEKNIPMGAAVAIRSVSDKNLILFLALNKNIDMTIPITPP